MNEQLAVEAFILCWNEEKMIRHTLNHYQKFCNKITIIDNCSTDDSVNIALLSAMAQQGTNIEIKQFETKEQIRDDAYLHIKNTIWKNSTADYVIVCDMDELLYHTNIIEQLNIAKKNKVGIIPVNGYNMVSDTFPENYLIPITQQVNTGVRAFNFDKSIIFSPQIIDEMLYGPGAHTCNPIYKKDTPKITHNETFKLLHYKYLGYDYLLNKHEQYAKRLSEYNKKNNFGGEYLKGEQHVKECFSILKKQKLLEVI